METEYPYVYAWANNPKRETLKGRRCRVIARGMMNSAMVEFEDGSREIISRNALRKADKRKANPWPSKSARAT